MTLANPSRAQMLPVTAAPLLYSPNSLRLIPLIWMLVRSPVKVIFWLTVVSGLPVMANFDTSACNVVLVTNAAPLPLPIAMYPM